MHEEEKEVREELAELWDIAHEPGKYWDYILRDYNIAAMELIYKKLSEEK